MTAIGNDVDLKSQCVWFAQWSTQWLVQLLTRWKLTMGWVGPKETYKVTCHMCLVGPMVEPLKTHDGLGWPIGNFSTVCVTVRPFNSVEIVTVYSSSWKNVLS